MKSRIYAVVALVLSTLFSTAQTRLTPAQVFVRVKDSVVVILASNSDVAAQGSGFVVGPGQVATNFHVVEGMSAAYVAFQDGRVEKVKGTIHADPDQDLAVLSVPTGDVAALRLGDELSLHEGDRVLALGAPQGLNLSLSDGIVSSFRKMNNQFVIQNTAAINHGSSGGPLLDEDGQVIGVTTFSLENTQGLYFAVGITALKQLLRDRSVGITPLANLPRAGANEDQGPVWDLIRAERYDAAIQQAEETLAANPDNDDAQRQVLTALIKQGEFILAIRKCEAMAARRSTVRMRLRMAKVYYLGGRYGDAERLARLVIRDQWDNSEALKIVGGYIFMSGDEKAWRNYAQHLPLSERDGIWYHVYMGYLGIGLGYVQNGINDLEAATRDDFPDPAPYLALAGLYLNERQIDKADKILHAAAERFPFHPQVLLLTAQIDMTKHRKAEARQLVERIQHLTMVGSTGFANNAVCDYNYFAGQPEIAMPYCRAYVDGNPGLASARTGYGWALLEKGDFKEAEAQFAKAEQLRDRKGPSRRVENVEISWGTILAAALLEDRNRAEKLLKSQREHEPSAVDMVGLENYPIIWSELTIKRINEFQRSAR